MVEEGVRVRHQKFRAIPVARLHVEVVELVHEDFREFQESDTHVGGLVQGYGGRMQVDSRELFVVDGVVLEGGLGDELSCFVARAHEAVVRPFKQVFTGFSEDRIVQGPVV